MEFIRPELRAAFLRWQEALLGAILAALGLWYVLAGGVLGQVFGALLVAVGLALLWDGVRRARFPAPGGGAGMVEVDERRITYFGPEGGGAISIEDLIAVTIRTTDAGPLSSGRFWMFTDSAGQRLLVPSDAEGAGALFDALGVLSGADYDAVIAANASATEGTFDVWRKNRPTTTAPRLVP